MAGWIVLGVVVLLILLLLSLSVVIVVDVGDDGAMVALRLGPLRFQLFPMKERPVKQKKKKLSKRKKKPSPTEAPPEEKPKPKKKLPSFDELLHYIELGKEILGAVGKGMRRIFKGIRITELELDFVIAGPDAAEAAISYGKISGLTWYGLGIVDQFFTLSIRNVAMRCDFESEESRYTGHGAVKLRIATMLAAALGIVFRVLVILVRERRNSNKG